MNKRLSFGLAAVLTTMSIALSPGASAANGWPDQAWRDMQKLAPSGSNALGRAYTLTQIQKTCRMLKAGVRAADIIDGAFLIANQSAADQKQRTDMAAYGLGVALVSGKRLCPAYLPSIWDAINR